MNRKKYMKQGIITLTVIFAILISSFAYAETIEGLKNQIELLKTERYSLRIQIDEGTMTSEQALAIMQPKIDALRELKDKVFEEKYDSLNVKISKLSEKNPERAQSLTTFMSELSINRESMKMERLKLHQALKSGEISREDAKKNREEIQNSFVEKHIEIRNVLKAEREATQEKHDTEKYEQRIAKEKSEQEIFQAKAEQKFLDRQKAEKAKN
jgi:patatin-like phospholipase/acyl hydrolase